MLEIPSGLKQLFCTHVYIRACTYHCCWPHIPKLPHSMAHSFEPYERLPTIVC